MKNEVLTALAEKWIEQACPADDYKFEPDNTNHLCDKAERAGKQRCANELLALIELMTV